MDATQQIEDPFSEEEDQEEEEKEGGSERLQLATLKVFKNDHIPEAEFPLYVGDNVLGRDPAFCSVLLPARSVSGRHAVISVSVFRSSSSCSGNSDAVEALLWDMGSLNGTRKGRFKLTPQVRYALTDGESVVIADVPCQYIGLSISNRDALKTPEKEVSKKERLSLSSSDSESKLRKGVWNGLNEKERSAFPPVPLWSPEDEELKMCSPQPAHKQPEITLVPESDSDGESATDERKDFVSDSASSSHLCSSTNSSFLTPAKKVIPESEDESSITPSSASMDRFRLRETSGEPCSNSSEPGLIALNLESETDFEETDMEKSKTEPELQPEIAAKVIPSAEFHMDSDTDVEEEEPETSKAEPEAHEALTLEKSLSSVGLHMDSDTDVEEEEDKIKTEPEVQMEQAPKVGPVPSAEFNMDSDTDVEEEDLVAIKANPESQNAVTLDKSVSSVGLHMDSDTDVEEEEKESKTKAQIEEAPKVKSVPLADLHMDSDTDVEENEAPITENISEKKAEVLAATESTSSAPPHTDFNLDSDTDVEDDNPIMVSMVTEISHPIGEGSDVRPTSTSGTELNMNSDTDVDEENEEKGKARDLLSNCETDDEDPFKPVPSKAVKIGESPKASVGERAEQSKETTHKNQDCRSQAKTFIEEPTQAFGHFEDWDLPPTQPYGAAGASAKFKPKQFDLEATQAYGTETDREEEQEEPLSHTLPYSNLSTAETQLIPVAKANDGNDDEEDEEPPNDSHLSTADTIIIASTPRREEQTQPFSLFTAQTQYIWDGEDKEFYQSEPTQLMEADTINETQEGEEENMEQGRRIHGGGKGKNSSSYLIIAETQPMCEEEATEAYLSGESFKKPSTIPMAEKYVSAHLEENNSRSHVIIAETQPMCDDEAPPDQDKLVSSIHTEKPKRSHMTIAETQPMFEEDQAQEDDLNEVSRRQANKGKPIQQTEKPSTSNIAIPETHVGEDDEGQEKELISKMLCRRSRRGRQKKEKEHAEDVVHHTIKETQLMCEKEQSLDEEMKSGINCGVPSTGQQTDEFKSPELAETDLKSCVTIAETQPMGEEETPCEDLTNAVSTSQIDEHSSKELPKPSSSHFIIAETLPMHEEQKGQEKNLGSKTSCRRSRRGKPKKDEVPQTSEIAVHDTITETQPVPEEKIERDEDLGSGVKSRRSRRGKPVKEDSIPQPAEAAVGPLSTITETQPVCEDGIGKDEDLSIIISKRPRKGSKKDGEPAQCVEPDSNLLIVEPQPVCEEKAQEEPCGRSSRRHRKEKTEVEIETPASGKVQCRTRKGQEGKRMRGKSLSEDEEESEEEKNIRRGTRRKGMKQKISKKEEEERLDEKTAQAQKERMETELQEQEEREREEREEKERLEHERKKQEESERAETEMRQKLEREQKELEKKEHLKKEEEEKIRKENERIQREKEEKERLEREEKERLESREREEQRRKEEERIQMEKEQREKERLEKKKQENEELQMRAKKQETEDRNHQEAKKNGRLEENKTELETPLVAPARRTRRCSSSSMNSDQSVSTQQEPSTQRGQGRGRGCGRGRQTTNEQPISARQSSRKGLAIGVEDTEQDTNSTTRSRSRSSSRSSERSANGVLTSNQETRGRGRGRGRKSVKLPEPHDVSQAETSGKGRGRGGRLSGVENVKAGMSNKREQDAEKVDDTAVPQTNSRGRKRAANTSTSTEEAPSPTPKTPRRSVSSQAHKVLFTGLTDEDGERVLSRLGGSLARGVNDMTHLVTDKARRTVKFLCAVARGVPIVSPDWLKKCGKAGHFLSTDEYILKDIEQEKKFSFSLQKALQTAQSQPLLKGYVIHVTPSVMPEPSQMKEIITCSGARFLPKMPSAHKENTVVVSCEQDRALFQKATSMSLPVVSTEFLLTGILQQRVDLQAYSLTSSLDTSNQPAAPKAAAKGRRK